MLRLNMNKKPSVYVRVMTGHAQVFVFNEMTNTGYRKEKTLTVNNHGNGFDLGHVKVYSLKIK